jgi:hypothetical protein
MGFFNFDSEIQIWCHKFKNPPKPPFVKVGNLLNLLDDSLLWQKGKSQT